MTFQVQINDGFHGWTPLADAVDIKKRPAAINRALSYVATQGVHPCRVVEIILIKEWPEKAYGRLTSDHP